MARYRSVNGGTFLDITLDFRGSGKNRKQGAPGRFRVRKGYLGKDRVGVKWEPLWGLRFLEKRRYGEWMITEASIIGDLNFKTQSTSILPKKYRYSPRVPVEHTLGNADVEVLVTTPKHGESSNIGQVIVFITFREPISQSDWLLLNFPTKLKEQVKCIKVGYEILEKIS